MKNCKKLLALVLVMIMALLMCACGQDQTDIQDGSSSSSSSTTDNSSTVSTDDGKVKYTVTVTDEEGNPVSSVMVQLCDEMCIPAVTNAEGVAEFNLAKADYYASITTTPSGYAEDTTKYNFDEGSYELTIILKAAE